MSKLAGSAIIDFLRKLEEELENDLSSSFPESPLFTSLIIKIEEESVSSSLMKSFGYDGSFVIFNKSICIVCAMYVNNKRYMLQGTFSVKGDMEILSRSIDQGGKRYFMQVQTDSVDSGSNKAIRITCCDGKSVWQSNKMFWNDLVNLKPEGIEESIQASAIYFAIYGKLNEGGEIKEEDLIVEFAETGSANLNITWKLKQMLGITIVLGAVILLKLAEEDSKTKLLDLLDQTVAISQIRSQLQESLSENRKIMEEYERVVKEKLEGEEELYTKFRILLNKTRT